MNLVSEQLPASAVSDCPGQFFWHPGCPFNKSLKTFRLGLGYPCFLGSLFWGGFCKVFTGLSPWPPCGQYGSAALWLHCWQIWIEAHPPATFLVASRSRTGVRYDFPREAGHAPRLSPGQSCRHTQARVRAAKDIVAKKQRSGSSKQCASLSHHVIMIAVDGYV